MSDKTIDMNLAGLDKLVRALKAKSPTIRVGILGKKNLGRKGDKEKGKGEKPNNATIGMYHEFGTDQLPVRSFLRAPLTMKLYDNMQKSGALNKQTLADVIKSGSLIPWCRKIAVIAEDTVLESFATGGYGTWAPSDMSRKKVHQTLVETQQLRDSIGSEVLA